MGARRELGPWWLYCLTWIEVRTMFPTGEDQTNEPLNFHTKSHFDLMDTISGGAFGALSGCKERLVQLLVCLV